MEGTLPGIFLRLFFFEEGVAGELLGHVLVPRKAEKIAIDVMKIRMIDLFKIGHAITSFAYRTARMGKSYKKF